MSATRGSDGSSVGFGLDGKVALVTGGASGIGAAIGRRLRAAGAEVVLVDVADASGVGDDFGAVALRCDVSNEAHVAAAFDDVIDRFGRVDIVCNNAGIGDLGGGVADADPEVYRRVFDVNVLGVVFGMKYASRHLQAGGVICNTASMAGLIGFPEFGAYTASKFAVVGLTKNAAIELAPRGIRVVAVAPTSVRTPMHDDSDPSVRAEVAFVRATHLVPRALDASEVAAAVHFLVSDDCTHLTGSILPLDGGSSAGPSTQLLQLASTRLDELPARPAP